MVAPFAEFTVVERFQALAFRQMMKINEIKLFTITSGCCSAETW